MKICKKKEVNLWEFEEVKSLRFACGIERNKGSRDEAVFYLTSYRVFPEHEMISKSVDKHTYIFAKYQPL